jgi:hypothetical protein
MGHHLIGQCHRAQRLKLSHPLRQPSIFRPQLLNHPTLSDHRRKQLLTRQSIRGS